MTKERRRATSRDIALPGTARLGATARDARPVEFEAIAPVRARAHAVSMVRRGRAGFADIVASARPRAAAAFRTVRHAAPAALLCLAVGVGSAKAEPQDAAMTLLALGRGAHGVLSVPMHVDTRGLPAVVLVHDLRGERSGADRLVEKLLTLGITVLEIEPFLEVRNGGAALPQVSDRDSPSLVTDAAEALALAEGVNRRAIGAVGFGAGAPAVLLAGAAAEGHAPLSARALLHLGWEPQHRPLVARALYDSQREAPVGQCGAASSPDGVRGGYLLVSHGDGDPVSSQGTSPALAGDLAMAVEARHIAMEEARRGVDCLASGVPTGPTAMPAANVGGAPLTTAGTADPVDVAIDTVIAFLADRLGATPAHAGAR